MKQPTFNVAINPSPASKSELTVLFSGSSQTKPSHRVGPQVLDYYLIHYIVSGKGNFQCMGKSYALNSGSSFVIFPGELVSYEADQDDPWHYRWIGLQGSQVTKHFSTIGWSASSPVLIQSSNRRIITLYRQIERTLEGGDIGCDMQAEGYMRILLGALHNMIKPAAHIQINTTSDIDKTVEQAVRWLSLQYSRPISIEQISQSLGYHRTHLSKMFKQYTGMSPMQFLLKIRMDRATKLLLDNLTIEQVASSVGFTDALYFSKQFKKWKGCSPSQYRDQHIGHSSYDCSP